MFCRCPITAGLLGLLCATPVAAQIITEFPVPTVPPVGGAQPTPFGITAGPDGAIWFTEFQGGAIGRMTTDGTITSVFVNPDRAVAPQDIAAGADGALWFTNFGGGDSEPGILRITTQGVLTPYIVAGGDARSWEISGGPDGALWFTIPYGDFSTPYAGGHIGRITTAGSFTGFASPTTKSNPFGIAQGADGNLWFTENQASANDGSQVGRITPGGVLTEFVVPVVNKAAFPSPYGITAGPDGALWFTDAGNVDLTNYPGGIVRMTTDGVMQEFVLTTPNAFPESITAGADGALWFTENGANKIGRITTDGVITEFDVPTANAQPKRITSGPDGNLWFTETNGEKIGRLAPAAGATPLVASVLPSSRSIRAGATATVFATMINGGSTAASGCAVAPVTTVPAGFTYQTTDPATNALIGSPNTPVSIAAGGIQSFLIGFATNAAFPPTDVALGFDCTSTPAAQSSAGLNTLLLSASTTPVPDVVALVATPTGDGIVDLQGASGANAFAIATFNLGAGAAITAMADTGAAVLPVSVSICETNPSTGQCVSAIGSTVSTTIAAGATPTFTVFVTGTGTVPFDPAASRVFVRFADAAGTIRGSTSVAVRTQ